VSQAEAVAFREAQKFKQWWVWLLVYGGAALTWYGFIQQIILGKPFGTNPAPDWMMWLMWVAIGLGLPVFFHVLKLIVEVGHDQIHIRYVPLIRRTIALDEIESYTVRTYRPIREFGGWGIRWGGHRRRAYNVSGDQGVDLKLRNGQWLMIGSQKPEELAQALEAGLQQHR